MGARRSSAEHRAGGSPPPGPSLRGLIRWRRGVAGAALAGAAAIAVMIFQSAGQSEFGVLAAPALLILLGSPPLLLGLLSLAIARGLGRPPSLAIRRPRALDRLLQDVNDPVLVVAVVLGTSVLVSLVVARALALPSAAHAQEPAFVSVFRTIVHCAIPLLAIGLVLAMARGFPSTRLAALKLALVQDLLTLVIAVAQLIPILFPSVSAPSLLPPPMFSILPPWLWMALALAFGGEAVYLLCVRWQ